jgi:heme-degrading monooxygenase HmoA
MPALPWVAKTPPDADQEYVVMASRLPLARHRYIPGFLRATRSVRQQLAATDGLVGYALDARVLSKTFLTLSVWQSREALDAFSAANPHSARVGEIRAHMRPTTFVFWTCKGSEVPVSWAEARRRLAEQAAT